MITKPRGTVDIYDKKMREYVALKMIIRNIMDLYNYDEIETPIFESNDLFSRAVGTETDIVAKEMFVFEDKKGRKMALRPEGTAPTVRMVLENKLYTPDNLPLKMFYLGQMFRYERPQNGRQRQFNQLGVEVFGTDNYLTDVEVISLAVAILKQIGIDEVACHINYLVSGPEREKYITNLKKELQALTLCDDCQKRLTNNPLRVLDCKVDADKFGKITHMQDFLTPENDAKFKHIIKSLEQIGIKCVIDPLLVRGLDYYTGVVFEIKAKDNAIGAQSTILGGGRYNKLVEELGGVALPAIGFGVGLERVLLTLEANNISLTNPKTVDAFILTIGDKTKNSATLVSSILRAAGISCEINHLDKNIKSAFKVAERINAKNILLIGEEELKNNVITIKNQVTKIEEKIAFDKLLDYFNAEQ